MPTLSSPVAPEVVMTTTSDFTSDDKSWHHDNWRFRIRLWQPMVPPVAPSLASWQLPVISIVLDSRDIFRDHFVCASSQWETTLHCNVVSHWLGVYTKWSLNLAVYPIKYADSFVVFCFLWLYHQSSTDNCILRPISSHSWGLLHWHCDNQITVIFLFGTSGVRSKDMSICMYIDTALALGKSCMYEWHGRIELCHDDVIKWKHFPRYWPFVRGIHRSPVNSPHKGQWHGALIFSLICAWINGWVRLVIWDAIAPTMTSL